MLMSIAFNQNQAAHSARGLIRAVDEPHSLTVFRSPGLVLEPSCADAAAVNAF